MAIALRAAQASKTSAASTSITMTVPTGVVDGDVMVMFVTSKTGTAPPTNPTGWTQLTNITSANSVSSLLTWRVASSEPASYSVTTPNVESAGSIIALSGASTTAPTSSQYSIQSNAASSTVSAATLGTWSSSNGIDIFQASMGTSVTTAPAPPTNYTEPTNHSATSGGTSTTAVTTDVAYRSLTAVTTVGAISATWGTSAVNCAGHCFIMEAAGGGGGTTANLLSIMGVGQ